MLKLVAVQPILYDTHQYEVGDELPDCEMKDFWLDAGTAAMVEAVPATRVLKAIPLTAQPGQIGISNGGNENDLAGRLPATPERAKRK